MPTFGEKLVRKSFNPSGNIEVERHKEEFAGMIDDLDQLRKNSNSDEAARCYSIAITHLETACMYAVKGVTA